MDYTVPNGSLTTCWFALFQKFWITKPSSGSSFVNGPNIASPEGSFQYSSDLLERVPDASPPRGVSGRDASNLDRWTDRSTQQGCGVALWGAARGRERATSRSSVRLGGRPRGIVGDRVDGVLPRILPSGRGPGQLDEWNVPRQDRRPGVRRLQARARHHELPGPGGP